MKANKRIHPKHIRITVGERGVWNCGMRSKRNKAVNKFKRGVLQGPMTSAGSMAP